MPACTHTDSAARYTYKLEAAARNPPLPATATTAAPLTLFVRAAGLGAVAAVLVLHCVEQP